jgi:CDP-4-dehydro-6-deoxyglucose reductase
MPTHKVQVQPSGREFPVAAGQTVLAAALDAGISLPHACKDGACGSCKGRVLAGRVRQGPHAASALSSAEEASGLALFCCATAQSDLVIEVRVPAALDGVAARRMPARIERIGRPSGDVAILWLKLAAGEQLLYRAGQYVDFLLTGGARRSYSIASMPGTEGPLEFHIRHMPGGTFTDALFGTGSAVKERSILRIEGPLGSFYLREDAPEPIVLLASGTGFAPVKAIAETIFAKGLNLDDPVTGRRGRPVVLYWGARTRADLYLDALPRRWAAEQANFRYVPVLSEPADSATDAAMEAGADVPAPWTGRTGLVHRAVMEDLPDLSAFQVYACGVPVMVEAAHRDFVGRCRLLEENFFSDAFVSRADLATVAAVK